MLFKNLAVYRLPEDLAGEFGVVLMIGGNIPGQTKVASLAIYDEVQSTHYDVANHYALVLLAFSFTILLLVYGINYYFSKSNTPS